MFKTGERIHIYIYIERERERDAPPCCPIAAPLQS